MSKFSGFNSRQQETTYNKFVYKTLEIFADEIITKRKFQFLYGKSSFSIDIFYEIITYFIN